MWAKIEIAFLNVIHSETSRQYSRDRWTGECTGVILDNGYSQGNLIVPQPQDRRQNEIAVWRGGHPTQQVWNGNLVEIRYMPNWNMMLNDHINIINTVYVIFHVTDRSASVQRALSPLNNLAVNLFSEKPFISRSCSANQLQTSDNLLRLAARRITEFNIEFNINSFHLNMRIRATEVR